jgi:hypothetical protein
MGSWKKFHLYKIVAAQVAQYLDNDRSRNECSLENNKCKQIQNISQRVNVVIFVKWLSLRWHGLTETISG